MKKSGKKGVVKQQATALPDEDPYDHSDLRDLTFVEKALPFALCALVFATYLATMYPTIPGGDSPELIVAAHRLGVAHPPGYPTFTMLGKLFTLIPFGSIAWRVNMMSGLCGTFAAAFIFHTVVIWQRAIFGVSTNNEQAEDTVDSEYIGRWTAFLAGAWFALCPLVWTYSTQAEVFALNNLHVAILLYIVSKYTFTPTDRLAYWGAFNAGLALSNQHTVVFYALPMVAWVFYVGRKTLLSPRPFLQLACVFFLGLVPYAYLIWAPHNAPPGSWGDTKNWAGFWKHFLREEYGTFRLYSGDEAKNNQFFVALEHFAMDIGGQSLRIGWVLVLVGFFVSFRARRVSSPSWILAFVFFFYMVVFHSLANLPLDQALFFGVHKRFWMQPYQLVFMWIAVGLAAILHEVCSFIQGSGGRALVAGLVLALVFSQISANYHEMDNHDNWSVHEYGHMILDNLPPYSMLVVKGDIITNSIRYLMTCEGVRPDIKHFDQSMATYEWFKITQSRHLNITFPNEFYNPYKKGGYSMFQLLQANLMNQPTFLCGGWYHDEANVDNNVSLWPYGFCERIYPKDAVPDVHVWAKESLEVLPNFTPPSIEKYAADSWEAVVYSDYWSTIHKRSLHFLNLAIARDNDQELITMACEDFDRIVALHPNPPDYYYKNQGVAWGRKQDYRAREHYVKAFKNYLRVAPKNDNDKERQEILRIVNS